MRSLRHKLFRSMRATPTVPTPPQIQTGNTQTGGDLEAKLLGLFEDIVDEELRRSVEDGIKILKNLLQSIPSIPPSSVDDPNNEIPPSFESVTSYLVSSSSGDGSLFTLPSTEPLALTRKYNRRWAVLPSMMANISCSGVEPGTLLRWLNTIFEKRFTPSNGVKACLLRFIDDGCDLGQVYGYLRPWMDDTPDNDAFSKIPDTISECRENDFKLRSAAINSNRIINPKISPRRIWDLYANRVLPFYAISLLPRECYSFEAMPTKLWAVSHSWVPSSKRQSVFTAINGKAWRVPLPCGTTLDAIRNELLILGAEYVFLDVLCLRQKDELLPEFESVRKREWRLDVPTIGHVYSDSQPVIVYFNGLGLPFRDGGANHGDKFHWFNRAWTLQECPMTLIPGGLKHKIDEIQVRNFNVPWASQEFCDHFSSMGSMWTGPSEGLNQSKFGRYVKEIQSRFCSKPVDQVACLAYLLGCRTLPIYDADMDVEVAWSLLLECLPGEIHTELLLSNFDPSGLSSSWRPTWKQVITCRTFRSMGIVLGSPPDPLRHLDGSSPDAGFKYGLDAYYSKSYVIEDCMVSIQQSEDQPAEALVWVPCTCDATPHRHQFRISEWDHQISPNATYILVQVGFRHPQMVDDSADKWWLLGQQKGIRLINNERAIEVSKVSVLKIPDTHRDGILGDGVKGRRTFVVYH